MPWIPENHGILQMLDCLSFVAEVAEADWMTFSRLCQEFLKLLGDFGLTGRNESTIADCSNPIRKIDSGAQQMQFWHN
jgi:hypothetical protein